MPSDLNSRLRSTAARLGARLSTAAATERTQPAQLPRFNQRVHILVEVPPNEDDIALTRQVVEGQGWDIRPPTRAEIPHAGHAQDYMIVEVRLFGGAWRAQEAATDAVRTVAKRHKLPLEVRYSFLTQSRHERRMRYRIIRRSGATDGIRKRFIRFWRFTTSRHTVHMPAQLTRQEIERELEHTDLGNLAFSAQEHELWPPPPEDQEEARARSQPARTAQNFLGGLALCTAMTTGYFLDSASGFTLIAALAVLAAVAAFLATVRWDFDFGPKSGLVNGIAAGTLSACGGWLLARNQPDFPLHVTASLILLAVLAMAVFPGLYFALQQTWLSRNIGLVSTIATPAAAFLVARTGRLMHASYLDGFDIPAGQVRSGGDIWIYLAAAEPLGIATILIMVIFSVYG